MSQLQKVCPVFGRLKTITHRTICLNLYQKKRLQSTSTNEETNKSEWDSARPLKEIPTISKLSMFLNFLPGGKFTKMSFIDLLGQFNKEHGDIFLFPGLFGRKSIVVLYNPEDFETVFRTEGKWPVRKSFEILKQHRSVVRKDFFQGVEGLLHTQDEAWGSFRSVVNPVLMQPRIIKSYISKLAKTNWEFIERIKDIRDPTTLEVPGTFQEELNRYTLESVAVVALDQELGLLRTNRNSPEAKKLFEHLTTFFELIFELEVKPSFWKIIPTKNYRRLMSAFDGMNDFVIKQVQEAVERLEKSPTDRDESEKGVLEKLLRIDKKIATVMAMDMLIAGVDTTTTSLTGILLALAKNPEKQQKLRNELRQALPQKDSPFTEESLRKMPYLRACIKESLRVYPLSAGAFRNAGKDIVLSGYRVSKDTPVSMITAMAMDDPKYFIEPMKFLPERWLRLNKADVPQGVEGSSSSNPFVYLPFGFGPRTCVGRRIVELEMEIAIARIVRNFNVEFNYSVENAFKNNIINVPAIPLKFKFTDIVN